MSNLSYHQPKVELKPTRLLARTIYAHHSYVSSVAFFGSQCDRLLTGSYDETAKLWDLKTGLALQKFQGHTDGITFVMPGPDGRVLTASEDRTLRVWDVDTGECLRVIRSHSGAVTSLCLAGPDRIVTGSSDRKLRVFDVAGHLHGETELDSEITAVASPPLPPPPRLRPHRGGGGGG
ncbi:WD repeat-containing protein (Partial), partial [Ectocarpus siliculosus]